LLYVFNKCFSPIPSLTSHITKGCIPYITDTKKVYDINYNKLIGSLEPISTNVPIDCLFKML